MPDRRLAAILAADVVGYSAMMEADQDGTLATLRTLRSDVIGPLVGNHQGRVVKSMGDGWLIEFAAASDAVACAIDIHRQLGTEQKVALRMGIHLGDVSHENEDVFGDGVNIAARLEARAGPREILISDAVQGSLDGHLRESFRSVGEMSLKNIRRPVRAWRWMDNAPGTVQPSEQEQPSIAVLAFENMSSDPEYGFFGDGLAEEIISTLSKLSALLVIARNSSFTYKGRAVDLRDVGRELGVRYVLEGSVRAAGGRIRVSAQLIDTADGTHKWAERYDRDVHDIFAIQDEITREIVTALQVRLTHGEERQLLLRGTDSLEAWSCALPALEMTLRMRAEDAREARNLLDRALQHDPGFASAYAVRGLAHCTDIHFGYCDDRQSSLAQLEHDTEQALRLDPDLALGHIDKAMLASERGQHEEAREAALHAGKLAANNALMRALLARLLVNLEDFASAESNLRVAMRANPFHPPFYFGILANALERQGQEAEAIEVLKSATEKHPDYFAGHLRLASLLGLAGETENAGRHLAEAKALNPRINREVAAEFYNARDAAASERFLSGLEAAGMSE